MDVSSSSLAMHSIELVKLVNWETDRVCNYMGYNQLTQCFISLSLVIPSRGVAESTGFFLTDWCGVDGPWANGLPPLG